MSREGRIRQLDGVADIMGWKEIDAADFSKIDRIIDDCVRDPIGIHGAPGAASPRIRQSCVMTRERV